MTHPIKTTRLKKIFNGKKAVNDVSLLVEPGQVYGLLGRNGAGKTTLLRMLLGIIEPTLGHSTIFGKRFASADENIRRLIAYIGQEYHFYNSYTLAELVDITAPLYPKWNWDKADELLQTFELKTDQRLGEMSGGQRQKAAMLVAFSCGAELLILDEPASALDPISRRQAIGEMMNFIADNPEKNTIIFSTHIVNDLERVATKVGMMDKGRITHEFELDAIHDNMRKVQIICQSEGDFIPEKALCQTIEGRIISAVYDISNEGSRREIEEARDLGCKVQEHPLNLEEFFVQIYGESSLISVQ